MQVRIDMMFTPLVLTGLGMGEGCTQSDVRISQLAPSS
jgi:hypothetical protein